MISLAEELKFDRPTQVDTTEQLSKIKELTIEADTLKLTLNERQQKENFKPEFLSLTPN